MDAAIRNAWALLLGMGLLMLGHGLQGTLLGVRATLEGFPTTATGILMSGYFAGFLAGSTLAPRLVTKVGHVRVFAALGALASITILLHAIFVHPAAWTAIRFVNGFCFAGLYVVAESWLNAQASNATRGRLLSIYMVISMGCLGLGQALLNVADPAGVDLFILVSVLVSIAVVPVLLSVTPGPPMMAPQRVGVRELWRISPLGVAALLGTVTAYGAFFGMGPVYAAQIGLSLPEISWFMGAPLLGAVLLQFPIGRLSDALDRRRVMTAVTFVAAIAALLLMVTIGRSGPLTALLLVLLGGTMLPMYSLCIAHTNDFLERDQVVPASGTLILVGGAGASVGPLAAAFAMDLLGPAGFFWWIAGSFGAIGSFALYRMARRPARPREAQGATVALPVRTTPTVGAMAATVAGEGQRAASGQGSERETLAKRPACT